MDGWINIMDGLTFYRFREHLTLRITPFWSTLDSGILIVATIVSSPSIMSTKTNIPLPTITRYVIHPYSSTPFTVPRLPAGCSHAREAKLSTNHRSIAFTPEIITNCSPSPSIEHLDSSLVWGFAANKTNRDATLNEDK